tara:strand:- start:141 stop:1313 length:1173 start_codon:yes stop_codon:yes gene_type:complete
MEENENVEEVQNTESTEEQVEQPQEEIVEEESAVSYKDDGTIVLDMNKINELENAVQEQDTNEVSVRDESGASEEIREENVEATNEEVAEQSIQQEVSNTVEAANEALNKVEQTGQALPENIQKLVDFVNDTGGSVEDYVRLNRNYEEMDNQTALHEYYERTKPHLSREEVDFLMEDQFSYDEEVDDEKDIKRKKLALKEQVAEAKAYLDGQKSKYYDEIKATPVVNDEYQKAMDFFNRYNEEAEQNQRITEERSKYFEEKTNEVFNDKFEGFEYNVGDQRFRVNVRDAAKIRDVQSDLNNFIESHLDETGKIKNASDYHRSIYTAMNPDVIARHFYEQGQADALKQSVAQSKNIDMTPRSAHGEVEAGGIKVRALDIDTSPSFKFKRRK